MKNSALYIDGHRATVKYNPVLDMFCGEFLHTGHAAKFMASSVKELKIAARDSLQAYERACNISGVEPFRRRSVLPLVNPLQRIKALLH